MIVWSTGKEKYFAILYKKTLKVEKYMKKKYAGEKVKNQPITNQNWILISA